MVLREAKFGRGFNEALMVTACLHHTLPYTVGFSFQMILVFWGWDWFLGYSASAADMSCSCVWHQHDFANLKNSLLTNYQALLLCYCPHTWSDKRHRSTTQHPVENTDFSCQSCRKWVEKSLSQLSAVRRPYQACCSWSLAIMWSPMRLTAFHFIPSRRTVPLNEKRWVTWSAIWSCSCIFMRRPPAQPPFALSRRHLCYIHNDQQW